MFPPPEFADDPQVSARALREVGCAALSNRGLAAMTALVAANESVSRSTESLNCLAASWDRLAPDRHLRDGGRYRSRRHGSYVLSAGELRPVGHRAHWQPVEYNALHGGIERWFEPIEAATAESPVWQVLLRGFGLMFSEALGQATWFVEAHQFRIDTADGIGRPTPEGAHRDGVDGVAIVLVSRSHIRGGETRVFESAGPSGARFTMTEPWSALLLDDQRVVHETTPIQPDGANGHRDTLVVTYRASGFQDPDSR